MTWLPINHGGDKFLEECVKITNDEELFANFKQNPVFYGTIGNDVRSKEIADIFYHNLYPESRVKSCDNDSYGNPILYDYPEGKLSPGTLCFLNILQDLKSHFGDISNFKVAEIGTGYGGQAKIILDSGVESYELIDVPETLGLAKKYLELFNYQNVKFSTPNSEFGQYDLVIAAWSLSEMDEEGIQFYFDKVISKSKYGYFLCNIWDDDPRKKFLLELLKDFNVSIYPENPRTSVFDNWVLVFKK